MDSVSRDIVAKPMEEKNVGDNLFHLVFNAPALHPHFTVDPFMSVYVSSNLVCNKSIAK